MAVRRPQDGSLAEGIRRAGYSARTPVQGWKVRA